VENEAEWDRLERRSSRIALGIALMPIPIALVVAWVLGSPPWRERPAHEFDVPPEAASPTLDWSDHGHR
jgi:hypothetical protein